MSFSTLSFIARRLLQLVPVVLLISTFNFIILQFAPGDAAEILAGQGGHATPEYIESLRREFGLDRSPLEQYVIYLGKIFTLDLGFSPLRKASVLSLILDRLPATALLVFAAIAAAILFGVLLGILSAVRRGTWLDGLVTASALFFYATPAFWLGLMLIIGFSLKLGFLPTGSMETIGANYVGFQRATDIAWHLVLPATTMALYYLAVYTRLMRASMLEVMQLDFVRTARAKGLTESDVALNHAAPNALLPVVTVAGLQIGHFMGGAVLIETIFGWPGLGRMVFDALLQRDINLLMGIFLISSVLVVLANLAADLVYGWLDPRIVHR